MIMEYWNSQDARVEGARRLDEGDWNLESFQLALFDSLISNEHAIKIETNVNCDIVEVDLWDLAC